MIDKDEQERWFEDFYEQALLVSRPVTPLDVLEIKRWAKSMSKIADQFIDNDDGDELVDA